MHNYAYFAKNVNNYALSVMQYNAYKGAKMKKEKVITWLFMFSSLLLLAALCIRWERARLGRPLQTSRTVIDHAYYAERAQGLPSGLLRAVSCIESRHNDAARRREQRLLADDRRVRSLHDIALREVGITSWGRYQILGIEVLSRGLATTPSQVRSYLQSPQESAELAAAILAANGGASTDRVRLLNALAVYNCGPKKAALGCGKIYGKNVLRALEEGLDPQGKSC